MLAEYKILFRNRNFLLLWASQVLSQLAIQFLNFLLLVLLFERTNSTIATSFLWISYSLPSIFIGPFASFFVDISDKRKILVITNFLQGALIFIYSLSLYQSTFLIYGVAVLYSLLNQFYVPAEFSSLPTLVKDKLLSLANGLFFLTQQSTLIIGFGLASSLYTYAGVKNSLVLSSSFLFAAFLATFFLPKMASNENRSDFEKNILGFVEKITEGYKLIKTDKNILAPLLLLIGLQISLTIVIVNAPLIATDILRIPIGLAGLLMIVPSGFGSAIGALVVPKFLKKGFRKISLIQNFLFLITLTIFILIFLLPQLNQNQRLIVGIFSLVVTGISFSGIFIPTQTFLQEKTPEEYRGRVFGNYWFLVTIATVFPVIFSGTISDLFGIKTLLLILALGLVFSLLFIKEKGESFLKK